MDLPVLQYGEQWLVQSRDVLVREIAFHAYLTNRRVILQSPHDRHVPDKDLVLDRVAGIESSANPAGEPVLALCAKTSSGENRRLFITFVKKTSGRSRVDERDAWYRYLSRILNTPARSLHKNEEQRVRYDPGKLVFSPGICDAGKAPPGKKEACPVMRESRKNDRGTCYFPGVSGSPPEIIRHNSSKSIREVPGNSPWSSRCPVTPADDGFFTCSACGSRVLPGSRYCDRCGARAGPPDPGLPVSSRDPRSNRVNGNHLPDVIRDPTLHFIDDVPRSGARGQIPRAYESCPSRNRLPIPHESGAGMHHQSRNSPEKFSGAVLTGKRSPRENRNVTSRSVREPWKAPVSRWHRIAISGATVAMIACIAAGLFLLVSPVGFARVAGTILHAEVFLR